MSKKVKDLAERVILTFVGAFIAVYVYTIASGQSTLEAVSDKELLDKALTAGIAALVPLTAGLVGFKVGDKTTASILPVKETPVELRDANVPQDSPSPVDRGH